MGMKIGHGCTICRCSYYGELKNIEVGDNVYIQRQVFFHAGGKIIIGNGAGIGCRSTLITGTHELGPPNSRWKGKLVRKNIVIEEGVWVGAGVLILPGVNIGAGSVVGAGAVVVHSIPKNTIVGGVPAKVIKILEG